MRYTIEQSDIEVILGRPLTANELSAFDVTIADAINATKDKLGINWDADGKMIYRANGSLPYIATEPFTGAPTSVTVDGKKLAEADYYATFNGDENSNVKNSITFVKLLERCAKIEIEANWGFGSELPIELMRLIIGVWLGVTQPISKLADKEVRSKAIEDYQVTYADTTSIEDKLGVKMADVISKWARRPEPLIEHSRTIGPVTKKRRCYYGNF